MASLNKQLIDLAQQQDYSAKVPSVEYSKMKMVNIQMKAEFEKMSHLKVEKAQLEKKLQDVELRYKNKIRELERAFDSSGNESDRIKMVLIGL